MDCKLTFTSHKKRNIGIALAELMVAGGIGVLLVATMTVTYVFYLKSFANLENYMTLNSESQIALNRMTKEIRQADSLVSYSVNKLTFAVDGKNVSYAYDPAQQTLARVSGSDNNVLLFGCTYWTNNIYDRNMNVLATSAATNCKVVQLTWICAASVLGRTNTTEDVQSSKVVIRKQKS